MGINKESATKAEEIARRIAKENGQSESLWQMFLSDAYNELFGLTGKESS